MKKLVLLIVICFCGTISQPSYAQISFNLNISSQPIWGPVGYDHVEYYYLPEIGAYYYVPTRTFFCLENGRWINRPSLYGRYRDFDLYRARKIVVNEPRPYLRDREYKMRYANQRNYPRQVMIRDSHDNRYFEIKDHPEHSKWNNGRGNGKDQRVMDNRDNQNRNQNMNQNRNDNRYQNQNRNDNRNDNKDKNKNKEQGPGRDR